MSTDTTPYCGQALSPAGLMSSWNLDPPLLLGLLALSLAGLVTGVERQRLALLLALLVAVFVSPLCALTTLLFSARTLHHLLLVLIVAPVAALALPWRPTRLGVWLTLTIGVLVLWHLPSVYSAAWQHIGVYWLLQLALLLPATLLWSHLLVPVQRGVEGPLTAALAIAALAGSMGLIGAVLTFAPRILYPEHLAEAAMLGFDPLRDQQLAGLIMWVGGMVPLAGLAGLSLRRAWMPGRAA